MSKIWTWWIYSVFSSYHPSATVHSPAPVPKGSKSGYSSRVICSIFIFSLHLSKNKTLDTIQLMVLLLMHVSTSEDSAEPKGVKPCPFLFIPHPIAQERAVQMSLLMQCSMKFAWTPSYPVAGVHASWWGPWWNYRYRRLCFHLLEDIFLTLVIVGLLCPTDI